MEVRMYGVWQCENCCWIVGNAQMQGGRVVCADESACIQHLVEQRDHARKFARRWALLCIGWTILGIVAAVWIEWRLS